MARPAASKASTTNDVVGGGCFLLLVVVVVAGEGVLKDFLMWAWDVGPAVTANAAMAYAREHVIVSLGVGCLLLAIPFAYLAARRIELRRNARQSPSSESADPQTGQPDVNVESESGPVTAAPSGRE